MFHKKSIYLIFLILLFSVLLMILCNPAFSDFKDESIDPRYDIGTVVLFMEKLLGNFITEFDYVKKGKLEDGRTYVLLYQYPENSYNYQVTCICMINKFGVINTVRIVFIQIFDNSLDELFYESQFEFHMRWDLVKIGKLINTGKLNGFNMFIYDINGYKFTFLSGRTKRDNVYVYEATLTVSISD